MLRLLAKLILAAIAFPCAAATHDLSDPVPGQPGRTWLDVAKIFLPDLHLVDGVGHAEQAVPLRHLVEGYGGKPPATIRLTWVDAIPFRGEGRDGTLILLDLGETDERLESTVVLAYFDEQMRLVDAVDIGMDRQVGLSGSPFRISNWNDAVPVYSAHHNSNQSYEILAPVFLHGGRFQLLDTFSTFGESWCGVSTYQSVQFAPAEQQGDGFWPVEVTMKEVRDVDQTQTCEELGQRESSERQAVVTYTWDVKSNAYAAGSTAIEEFTAETADSY